MTTKIWHSCTLLVAALTLPAWSHAENVRITHHEDLQQLETRFLAASLTQRAGDDDARRLESIRFNAFGRHFDLRLVPNRRLLQSLPAAQRSAGLGVYRGELNGVPGSWVRLVYDGESPTGLFSDGKDVYAIESGAGGAAVVFRLDDIEVPPGMLSCSAVGMPKSAAGLLQKIAGDVGVSGQEGPGATQNLDIGIVADFEFTDDKGSNVQAELMARMNNVDGIFSEQLGVQLTVTQTDTFPSANDPFDASDASSLLDEVADYRAGDAGQSSNGLTHLFTGRDLDGSTVGIAFTPAICRSRSGAGLTQATHSATIDSLIAAHEIGHNFGAPHDGTSGSPCETTSRDFLMAPSVNGSDRFSNCSIAEMQDTISRRGSCITALPSTDVAVTLDEAPATPLLGNLERVRFSVDSIGTEDASDVSVDVSIPGNVTLDSISAIAGTCTSGAGTASCSLGEIPAGSGSVVSVTVRLDAVGNAQFVADVTANGDANTSNDRQTVNIDVTPAVDLVVTGPATSTVTLDRAATLRITVENRASIAATDVEVTISADADLRIDSVSWPDGSCTVSGGDATCDAASLSAQSTATIKLGVTGTAEGSQRYSVSASANEPDRDAASNDMSGSVSVDKAPPGDDDSGGGSVGWLLIAMLLSACMGRRRRRLN